MEIKEENEYEEIGDDSLFRKGPACLKYGIEEAVRRKDLIPIYSISPSQEEKDSAALEVIKLHQLVLTQDRKKKLRKPVTPAEALDEESMEDAVPCLITTTNETIKNESWLGSKRATYTVQKATLIAKDKVSKVEESSNYLISPLRKRYDTFFRSTMCTLKAIRCWLKLKPTKLAPKWWLKKQEKIYTVRSL